MKNLNHFDALIAPIHSFTLDIPQYVDQNLVRVSYLDTKENSNQFYVSILRVISSLKLLSSMDTTYSLMKI